MQLNISYFIKKLLPSFSKDDSLEDLETSLEYISTIFDSYAKLEDIEKVAGFSSKQNKEIIKQFYFELNKNKTKGKLTVNKVLSSDRITLCKNAKVNGDFIYKELDKALNDVVVSQALTAYKANLLRCISHYYFITRFALDFINYLYVNEAENAKFEFEKEYGLNKKQKEFIEKNIWVFARLISVYGEEHSEFENKLKELEDINIPKEEVDNIVELYNSNKVDIFNNLPFNFIGSPIYSIRLMFAQWTANRYHKLKDQKKLLELRYMHLKLLQEQGNTDINLEKEIEAIQSRITSIDKSIYDIEKDLED